VRDMDEASAPDRDFVHALSAVKEAIGEWHDWCELETMAGNSENDSFCQRTHAISDERLNHALTTANDLRRRYLGEGTKRWPAAPAASSVNEPCLSLPPT
jgi:hypothetical protein